MNLAKGDRVRTLVDAPAAWEGVLAVPAGSLGVVDGLPVGYGGYGIVVDADPTGQTLDYAANEIELVVFKKGDKIVCPNMTLRAVDHMADRVDGEPLHVVASDGGCWPVAACLRANWEDLLAAHRRTHAAGARVRTDPDPADPEWQAALDELGRSLDFLRIADPSYRVALAEDDARDAVRAKYENATGFAPVGQRDRDEPLGWSFRVGFGATTEYGVVPYDGDVNQFGLYTYRAKAERALMYEEPPYVAARRVVRSACPNARDFQPVHSPGGELLRGWTFATGRDRWERFGAVTAGGRVSKAPLDTDRATARRRLLDDDAQA